MNRLAVLSVAAAVLASVPAAGNGVTPPYEQTYSESNCADYGSSTIRRCLAAADSALGTLDLDLDIVAPRDGNGFGYGAGEGTTEVRQRFVTTSTGPYVTFSVKIYVTSAAATHSGILTNTVGRVHSGYTGLSRVHLHAVASSDCGVRPNHCYGSTNLAVVSSRDPLNNFVTDEQYELSVRAQSPTGAPIPSGTTFTLSAGAHARVMLDTASGAENGEVASFVDARVLSISIE